MAVIKRKLTLNLDRSTSTPSGKPTLMEVVVTPLASPSTPANDLTMVGERQAQEVLLNESVNPVVFELVPSDYPDLTERIPYRIAWRPKYLTGRTQYEDFAMPDFDCDFDDLGDLSQLLPGEMFLQETDLGVPSRVARLNDAGQVVDAFGTPVTGSGDYAILSGQLNAEKVDRQLGDQFLRNYFQQVANDQVSAVTSLIATRVQQTVDAFTSADLTERSQRIAAVNQLNTDLAALETELNAAIATINGTLASHTSTLTTKADLVGGKVPTSQLPDLVIGRAVPVANQAAMLALTSADVQRGDFAVRPDGVWFLNADNPALLGSWLQFTVAGAVTSVNSETGAVVLNAGDVGARSATDPVPLADVTGLTAALSGKSSTSTTNALDTRITTIENDTHIVRTDVSNLIAASILPTTVVFVNNEGQLVKKNGDIIGGGGGGGPVTIADVIGLVAALSDKLDSDDASVTNPRVPTAHASSHASAGSDPITPASIGARAVVDDLDIDDVSGLQTALDGKGSASTVSNHGNRINSLENRVDDLEDGGGGGGGGGGSYGKTIKFDAATTQSPLDDTIQLESPFGEDTPGHYYYDPAGAAEGESRWPYIHKTGYPEFRALDWDADPDPDLVTEAVFEAYQDDVTADFGVVNAAIDTKAAQSSLNDLEAVVDTKVAQTAFNTLTTTVGGKADQSAITTLTTAVGTKANQVDLEALEDIVNANTGVAALEERVDDIEDILPVKADLVSGLVPNSQLRTDIPITNIATLTGVLAGKADLSGGKVPLAQIPTGIPTSSVSGLDASLAAKADLVSGKIPTSQIPAQALVSVQTAANRAGMLALTAQQGDVCVITGTDDLGTYMLQTNDPTVFSNWVKMPSPSDLVSSVNGQTGVVVLSAADVGARSSATAILQSEVTGLPLALTSKADLSAMNTALAGKTSPTDVTAQLTAGAILKQGADYCATTSIGSTSGQQSVDGVLVALGSIVLLTAQPSSVNNGLWQVNSGTWTRVSDMAASSHLVKGSGVFVKSGNVHAYSLFQETNNSGIVGTDPNNWVKTMQFQSPITFTASLGVDRVGNDFRSKTVSGGGVIAASGGLSIDTTVVPRCFSANVPASNPATITHNLNKTDIGAVYLREVASGDLKLICPTVTGPNTISLDFESAPSSGQYRVTVLA